MIISKIIPDERSNQLIVIATERSYARVQAHGRPAGRGRIDGGDGRIHVYYCENANCDELAQTLGAVTGVPVNVGAGGAGGADRDRAAAAPAAGAGARGRRPARRASRTCCSRARCGSTSIARPTR